jgi:hypothetical protein
MEIIFHGRHDSGEATESLAGIIKMLKKKYQIGGFREMHLSVTLVDESGVDVELIDSETDEAYRTFEVYRQSNEVPKRVGRPNLKLVVDKGD